MDNGEPMSYKKKIKKKSIKTLHVSSDCIFLWRFT